jgi:acetoin utilization deacetylase AcuC-like enzyme
MKLIYHPLVLEHDTGTHPESFRRFNYFDNLEALPDAPDGSNWLTLVHPEAYVEMIQHHAANGLSLDGDTNTSHRSYEAASAAVGLTLKAMEQRDFALIRPPGHHAYRNEAHGFCLFNNVAIAAQKAAEEGKKVLILDFDGHLGDGTMDIFYHTDQVLYWSLHQYPAYPGHGYGNEIGEGPGKFFTINNPLPPGSGDDVMWHAVEYMFVVAEQFNPDIVAVSAGFDAHQFDPMLQLRATGNFYYRIGKLLAQTFPGKVFGVLEGGYNPEELPKCVANFLAGVNLEPTLPFPETPTASGLRVWETYEMHLHTATGALAKHWKF